VAYIYLDSKNQQSQENIVRALLAHLLGQLPTIPNLIQDIWKKGNRDFPAHRLLEMFCEACKAFTESYICIDAIDECDEKERTPLLGFFQKAHKSSASFRLICTGRPNVESIMKRQYCETVSFAACEPDIRIFAKEKIENDENDRPAIMDPELKDKIIQKLIQFYEGT
jgi:hypothetical protein